MTPGKRGFRQFPGRTWGLILAGLAGCADPEPWVPQDGDLVFQTAHSAQSLAIQVATGSPFSHVGLVVTGEDGVFVLEAAGRVRYTALADWILQGKGGRFVVKRLAQAGPLKDPETRLELRLEGQALAGLAYDPSFDWSDESYYCSELVWKVYERALGIQLCPLQPLSDFDLDHPLVASQVRERWGDGVPLEEPVVSPAALLDSPLLVTVHKE